MYYYRALNPNDIYNLKIGNNILSSRENKYKKCVGEFGTYIDFLIGHINGKALEAQNSPLISASKDFKITAHEYSIPQNGKYNSYRKRKIIAIIEADPLNDKVTKEIRTHQVENKNYMFELSQKNCIKNLYDLEILKINNDFSSFDRLLRKWRNNEISTEEFLAKSNERPEFNCQGFENYAVAVKEVIFIKHILKDSIVLLLDPFFTDLLYAHNDIEFIKQLLNNQQKLKELQECFKNLSPDEKYIFEKCYQTIDLNSQVNMSIDEYNKKIQYTENCKTLIDIACDIFENKYSDSISLEIKKIANNDLKTIYEILKRKKQKLISKILTHFKIYINQTSIDLIENHIHIIHYDELCTISDTRIYDVLAIQKDEIIIKDKQLILEEYNKQKAKRKS